METKELSIENLMTKAVVTINENEDINKIEVLFQHSGLSHLVVVNDEASLVGVLSKTDLLSYFKFLSNETSGKTWSKKQRGFYTAKHIMSTCLETLDVNEPVEKAYAIFVDIHCHCIPILDEKKLVGIMTPFDIVKFLYENKVQI